MQEIFQGHGEKSMKFYTEITKSQAQIAWEVKRKLSKKCAFTLENLRVPVRSIKCKTLKCVYEQQVILALIKGQGNNNEPFQCIQCGVQISQSDLFFDSELSKALKQQGVCYLKNLNHGQQTISKQTYVIVDKKDEQAKCIIEMLDDDKYMEIETSDNQQLLQILALNIYKQRMETLQFLATQQERELNLKRFATQELNDEINRLNNPKNQQTPQM